ncbi:MAG TPA: hypothetical protein VMB52_05875 [Verrucomicrobiae bacterium]|nr:hypothetical protein [Verrucomicrobiae bacterium]
MSESIRPFPQDVHIEGIQAPVAQETYDDAYTFIYEDERQSLGQLNLDRAESSIYQGLVTSDSSEAGKLFDQAQEMLAEALSSTAPVRTQREAKLWKLLLPGLRLAREGQTLSVDQQQHQRRELADWIEYAGRLTKNPNDRRDLMAMGVNIGIVALSNNPWTICPLPNRNTRSPQYILWAERGVFLVAPELSLEQDFTGQRITDEVISADDETARIVIAALRDEELSPGENSVIENAQTRSRELVDTATDRTARLNESVEPSGTDYDDYKRSGPELGFPLSLIEHLEPEGAEYIGGRTGGRYSRLATVCRGLEQAIASGNEAQFALVSGQLAELATNPPGELLADKDMLSRVVLWNAYIAGFEARMRREPIGPETVVSIGERVSQAYELFATHFRHDAGSLSRFIATCISIDLAKEDPRWLLYPSLMREGMALRSAEGLLLNHDGYLNYDYRGQGGWKLPVAVRTARSVKDFCHPAVKRLTMSGFVTRGWKQYDSTDQMLILADNAKWLSACAAGRPINIGQKNALRQMKRTFIRVLSPLDYYIAQSGWSGSVLAYTSQDRPIR